MFVAFSEKLNLKTWRGIFSFEIPPDTLESLKTWGRGDPWIVLEIVNRTQIQTRIIFKLKQISNKCFVEVSRYF